MNISLIAGARPNFMKIAPLIPAFRECGLNTRLIHTGQHYDAKMSDAFFEELRIPHPDVNLGVGSGSHVAQISQVMSLLENDFNAVRPQAVVVVGDVNSTLAGALTAVKMNIPVAHVEAGLRSFDRTMPEETNRILTDAISTWLFTTELEANENLRREGISSDKIHMAGNVMIDTLLGNINRARGTGICRQLGVQKGQYAVLTLHRPSNVDSPERFEQILRAVHQLAQRMPVVFPLHPRTRGRLSEFGFGNRNDLNGYTPIEPLGYLSMLGLLADARIALTDSGGIQEETTVLGVPCLTLRENTERPITITHGTNRLVGWRTDDILAALEQALQSVSAQRQVPENWDGHAAPRIAAVLARDLG